MIRILFNITLLFFFLTSCNLSPSAQGTQVKEIYPTHSIDSDDLVMVVDYPVPGASQFDQYLPLVEGKSVGLVVNKASQVEEGHLVDALIDRGLVVKAIFAPEHGFRGDADAGEKVDSSKDSKTGLDIVSLYGSNKKPSKTSLDEIDVMIFDLQDVGVRFYTYLSTLHYVMEAAAELQIPVIVLDRPNPNGFYTAGPVLEMKNSSFVGLHPVPIVTGMTIGEYSQMINGEGWLEGGIQCDLTVVKCPTYKHKQTFELPVAPSPNLPNHRSVLLYPSLCLFEGTTVSVGRGTPQPFQHIGHPKLSKYDYNFVPKSGPGSKYPKHENVFCFGKDFSRLSIEDIIEEELDLSHLFQFARELKNSNATFFNENNFFEKLAGTTVVREAIMQSISLESLEQSWSIDLDRFLEVRKKYLLYQ